MKPLSRLITTNVVCALLLLFLPATALAEPLFRVTYDSFTDINSNGRIDCGELVRFHVSIAETVPSTNVTGSIVVPSSPAQGWFFRRDTVEIDNILSVRCVPTIVHGNSAGYTFAQVDYSCSTLLPPNAGYVLAFYVSGHYVGDPSGNTMIVPATHTQGSLTQTTPGQSWSRNLLRPRRRALEERRRSYRRPRLPRLLCPQPAEHRHPPGPGGTPPVS